ncbi:Uncharacterised protein [Klebsiella pneumoniae]|nr:Uncharacterised protein [Klebsiella pneumoniae]
MLPLKFLGLSQEFVSCIRSRKCSLFSLFVIVFFLKFISFQIMVVFQTSVFILNIILLLMYAILPILMSFLVFANHVFNRLVNIIFDTCIFGHLIDTITVRVVVRIYSTASFTFRN